MIGLIIAQIGLLALGLWARRLSAPPQTPGVWLGLITAGTLPTVIAGLMFLKPDAGHVVTSVLPQFITNTLSTPRVSIPTQAAGPDLPWFTLYFSVAALLFARHAMQLFRLHRVSGTRAPDHDDLFLTDAHLPPCALGLPRRRIIMSKALWATLSPNEQSMLLAHERCHIAQRDPEVTLGLLAMQSLFWVNPGFRALVSGWREAVERRADAAAIHNHDRRDYAHLFTRLARTAARLPVPTQSKPRNSGDLIMRLNAILHTEPRSAPKRSVAAIFGLSLAACLGVSIAGASPAADPKPIKTVPPIMPLTCPGMTMDDLYELTVLADTITVSADGETILSTNGEVSNVGRVNLRYNINAAGQPTDITVTSANHTCFRAPSIAAVQQWQYAPGQSVKGVETQIRFSLSIEDGTSLQDTLDGFMNKAAQ